MAYPVITPAAWRLSLPRDLARQEVQRISEEADRLAAESQYGWGHTIDFGSFRKQGLLKDSHLRIAGAFDEWSWWPPRLDGLRIADVGCFTGGLSLLMAERGAEIVYAVDEIPAHLAQCTFLADAFELKNIEPVLGSAYRLGETIEPASLDIVLLAGVLYHMSDMLVGLYAMRELLKPGGLLLLQSHAVDDFEHSYANFGRFVAGRWWQPTGLCVKDMLDFMGYTGCDVRFYSPTNCLARAARGSKEIAFKRGLNWAFDDLRDAKPRSLDMGGMAPSPLSNQAERAS